MSYILILGTCKTTPSSAPGHAYLRHLAIPMPGAWGIPIIATNGDTKSGSEDGQRMDG